MIPLPFRRACCCWPTRQHRRSLDMAWFACQALQWAQATAMPTFRSCGLQWAKGSDAFLAADAHMHLQAIRGSRGFRNVGIYA